MFGIPGSRDVEMIAKKANTVKVPDFVPRSGVVIDVSDAEAALRSRASTSDSKLDELKKFIPRGGNSHCSIIDLTLRHLL